MYVLITWKHSAKTMMHERATDQMIWMSFLTNIWYISIKPVGLESFWTEAREQVTSGKELATWKPQVLCIVDITACASKAQPRAWITTYVQTHKVQVCTSQTDRKSTENMPKLRVQWYLWTSNHSEPTEFYWAHSITIEYGSQHFPIS